MDKKTDEIPKMMVVEYCNLSGTNRIAYIDAACRLADIGYDRVGNNIVDLKKNRSGWFAWIRFFLTRRINVEILSNEVRYYKLWRESCAVNTQLAREIHEMSDQLRKVAEEHK